MNRYTIVVQDLETQWLQSYPCETKTSQETQKSLMKFLEPTRKPKVIYTDNSLEFGKSCEDLSWNHCTSTPHRSETNGSAERAVRRVKEGTSPVLLQYGHLLVGLLLERQFEKVLLEHGREKVPSWECLFVTGWKDTELRLNVGNSHERRGFGRTNIVS